MKKPAKKKVLKREEAARAAYRALRAMELDHEEAYNLIGEAYWLLKHGQSIEREVKKLKK